MYNGNGYPPPRGGQMPPYPLRQSRVKTANVERWLQQGLAIVGSLLMPAGLVAIVLGWYGAAHTPYVFEQLAYLISGGLFGLGLLGAGGFLFFGSWLARLSHQQRMETELLAFGLSQIVAAVTPQDSEASGVLQPQRRRHMRGRQAARGEVGRQSDDTVVLEASPPAAEGEAFR